MNFQFHAAIRLAQMRVAGAARNTTTACVLPSSPTSLERSSGGIVSVCDCVDPRSKVGIGSAATELPEAKTRLANARASARGVADAILEGRNQVVREITGDEFVEVETTEESAAQ